MSEPRRIAVLVSGSGSNLQTLLDRFRVGGDDAARVVRVVASRPEIRAIARARAAGVEVVVHSSGPAGDGAPDPLSRLLLDARAELVVLAGYLQLVPAAVVREYRGRMINIHPALLPAFGGPGMYGRRVHAAVIDAGVRVTGVTVHFVDEEYDHGPIIAQWPVPVLQGDDADRLARRVLQVEHRLLPEVVAALAREEVYLSDEGRVVWTTSPFASDRFETVPAPG